MRDIIHKHPILQQIEKKEYITVYNIMKEDKIKTRTREYRKKNHDVLLKQSREYHETHRAIERKKNLDYYHKHQQHINKKIREWTLKQKILVLQHYSPELKCQSLSCLIRGGCKDIRTLSIDHIEGKGTQHRKQIGHHMYRWLKKNNFPEGYQVLCMNCQWIKRSENNENNRSDIKFAD